MLKVTYTPTGLYLEYLNVSLDALLADRARVHARSGLPFVMHPTSASIPLPASLSGLKALTGWQEVQVSPCDRDWVEVSLSGTWLATDADQDEGVFMAELRPGLEQQLYRLWQSAQTMAHPAWAVF